MNKLILIPLFILASCGRLTSPAAPSRPLMAVPEFAVRIFLSHAATEKLYNAGETIRGTIYFDGDGAPLASVKTAPHRNVILGSYAFELHQAGEIHVSDAMISKEAYARLSDTNYHFFINVYSGRHAFQNNVLSGGYAAGRLSDLDPEKPIEIKCNLQ